MSSVQRYGLIVALAHGGVFVVGWLAMPYLSAARLAPQIGAIGLVLGVYGAVLTLVGFGITIVQLMRTQSAASAARDAVENLKSSTLSFDSYYELARADSLISLAYAAVSSRRQNEAARAFLDFRRAVARILQLTPSLDPNAKEAMEQMMADIVAISAYFHDMGDGAEAGLTAGEVKARLTNYRDVLTLIEVRLRGQIGG